MEKTIKLLDETKAKLKEAIKLLEPQVMECEDDLPSLTIRKRYDKYVMNLKSLNGLEVNNTNYTYLLKTITLINKEVKKYLSSVKEK